MANKKQKVLLIGWDAADWKIINPLLDSGKMPTLRHIVENGTIGNVMTLEPPLSPMLWTSIATGKTADKHGILGFAEPDPDNGGIRYVEVTSRKCKALWNIFHHEGLKSNVVNWWPSYPAEPINGIYVANSFLRFSSNPQTPLALMEGTIFPEEYYKFLPRFKVHPSELTEQHLYPFFPDLDKMDLENDIRISAVIKEIANSATLQATTTYLLEETSWDFTAVYFDSIDHLCHGFMKY
jgi:predicted AlkP superfamily phosphohydrolase/phosphomutase